LAVVGHDGEPVHVELLDFPDRLVVRIHRELPRDPKRPHYVRTEPEDRIEWFCRRAGITYLSAEPDCPCCVPREVE
jgi:hypothetical protein